MLPRRSIAATLPVATLAFFALTGFRGCNEEVPIGEECEGDPDGIVCDVYEDGFACPAGSMRTVIECRPLCQDVVTCEEVPPTS